MKTVTVKLEYCHKNDKDFLTCPFCDADMDTYRFYCTKKKDGDGDGYATQLNMQFSKDERWNHVDCVPIPDWCPLENAE